MFDIMHNFWIQAMPMFAGDYEFIYIIFDFITIIVFFRFLADIGSFWKMR